MATWKGQSLLVATSDKPVSASLCERGWLGQPHLPAPQDAAISGIPVAEILSALSFALDLTEDAVPGHALRACLLGLRLAQAIGLGEECRSHLFYALLLKDVGCSSNAARLWQRMGTDERRAKRNDRLVDWTRTTWSGVCTAYNNLPPEGGALGRLLRLAKLGLGEGNLHQELIALRCDRGASIVAHIGLPTAVSIAVRHLDEHWDGSGFPDGLRGEQIPLLSRILLLAQHLDVFASHRGEQIALDTLAQRSGRWFDPGLVKAVSALHKAGLLWASRADPAESRAAVLDQQPGHRLVATEAQIDNICDAFAEVVDVKSSFTGSHSRGVTAAALAIAGRLGLSSDRVRFLRRASLLHDLGKLRVPNSILEKQGPLDDSDWAIIKEHPALTTEILSRVDLFAELAIVAGQHHECLNGTGYPHGLTASDLSLEARLIAVADVYGALSEDRPYRKALDTSLIRRIMDQQAGVRLDKDCYDALLASL